MTITAIRADIIPTPVQEVTVVAFGDTGLGIYEGVLAVK